MNGFTLAVVLSLGIGFLAASPNGQLSKKPSDADVARRRFLVVSENGQEKLTDADIARLLVGKWHMERKQASREFTQTQHYSFKKDETFTAHSWVQTTFYSADVSTSSGTWKVVKGSIEMTVTKWEHQPSYFAGKIPTLPYVEKVPLVSINDSMWTTVAEKPVRIGDPKEYVFKRLKDEPFLNRGSP